MSWTEIDKQLRELPAEDVIKLLKGLHDLSPQNKAWLRAKLLPPQSCQLRVQGNQGHAIHATFS